MQDQGRHEFLLRVVHEFLLRVVTAELRIILQILCQLSCLKGSYISHGLCSRSGARCERRPHSLHIAAIAKDISDQLLGFAVGQM